MNKEEIKELDAQVQKLLRAMTVDEKLSLLSGKSLFRTKGIPRLGLAPMKLTDGPRGVGFHSALRRCTAFPSGISLAASWDPELGREFGEALALEARSVGAQVVLGPAVNICRTPLNGRTFEYLSEDPELNSRLTVDVIRGIQSNGVAACVKHYAANNQETNRTKNSSRVSERALREIYLPAFEAAVREADVWSVMAAYNAVNGVAACEHKQLLNDILRQEYGFTGFVVSDWFAVRRTSSAAACLEAGLNLEMPGRGSRYRLSKLKQGIRGGRVYPGTSRKQPGSTAADLVAHQRRRRTPDGQAQHSRAPAAGAADGGPGNHLAEKRRWCAATGQDADAPSGGTRAACRKTQLSPALRRQCWRVVALRDNAVAGASRKGGRLLRNCQ